MKASVYLQGWKVHEFDLELPKDLTREQLEGMHVSVAVLEERTDKPTLFIAAGKLVG